MSLRTVILGGMLCIALVAVLLGARQSGLPSAPSADLRPQMPAALPVPLSPVTLDAAGHAASEIPNLHSLLVSWRGELLLERYSKGIQPTRLANIKSVSKSVMSALVGIAIDRGFLPGVKQPIESYFPEILKAEKDVSRKNITIENLLTMQSGLETTSNRNYGAWVLSSNWVRYALTRPLTSAPGTRMQYSTGNTHLLSAILTKAAGKNTWQFAQEVFAKPQGFTLARWPQDPQGIYFGGNDMLMTPRQMLKFGQLYLNRGKAGGVQVVPATWVDESFKIHAESTRERERFYGYGWWIRDLAGYRGHYAWGYGGQFIFVVPELDLVVVMTSASEVREARGRNLRNAYEILEDFVIPAIAQRQKLSKSGDTP
jgi:CubicO group peptidase (beta-lactamase class C family)